MDIRLSPPREGARGGREQFKWDDVKACNTKEREHYLGHSVKIGMVKYKNHFYKHDWYLKNDTTTRETDASEELRLIKLYEDELMLEMLGSKPKRLMLLKSRPTDVESLRKLLIPDQQDKPVYEDTNVESTEAKYSGDNESHHTSSYRTRDSYKQSKHAHRSRDHSHSRDHRKRHRSRVRHSPYRHKHRRSERSSRSMYSRY
ncbi:kinase phosphorylation protein, putative [Babesia ovis]|uniref:Kinase phosphorylation protein, putative n=1 Tax=Babesia ovis TaxID=5869 RepID=A0A9W5T8B6_BABOV|nr:kinase phosphorylation protein, putative [Babesia ovis]